MKINFDKNNGVLPVIVQDVNTHDVLMFAYMNEEAYDISLDTKELTFFSLDQQELWIKSRGEVNSLILHTIELDEDESVLLIKAEPTQPIGENGKMTKWGDTFSNQYGIIEQLEKKINDRKINPKESSYISSLFERGISEIAKKVGKESVDMIIESKEDDKKGFLKESADLFMHYLVLLKSKGVVLNDVLEVLKEKR